MAESESVLEAFVATWRTRLGANPTRRARAKASDRTPRAGVALLRQHLQDAYGEKVTTLTELRGGVGVFKAVRADGTTWVARVFPPTRPLSEVEGDAAVLGFLERCDFAAERLATTKPVTQLDEFSVLVTEFVKGVPVSKLRPEQSTPPIMQRLGDYIGRLHALPLEDAPTRPGGSCHHASVGGGTRRTDVDVLLPVLEDAQRRVDSDARKYLQGLASELQEVVDDFAELPQGIVHLDLGGPNLLATPNDEFVAIDWTSAGRGARILGLAGFAVWPYPLMIERFLTGYRAHIALTDDEVSNLYRAVRSHSLVLEACMAIGAVASDPASLAVVQESTPRHRQQAKAGVTATTRILRP